MPRTRWPGVATIVAFVALFVVLGGTATAAKLISGKHIRNNSITGKDIKSGSIKLSDIGFYNGDGAGPVTTVESPEVTIQPGQTSYDADPNSLTAVCPSGMSVIGTGFNAGIGTVAFSQSFGSLVGAFVINDTSIPIQAKVQAICAYGDTSGSAASAARMRESDMDRFKRQARAVAKEMS